MLRLRSAQNKCCSAGYGRKTGAEQREGPGGHVRIGEITTLRLGLYLLV
ncbi:hypothetical protein [Corynebacterium sp. HMSC08C04]|nr:hypothetical protein [Corynebacterium sp. HMSC08C04]